jgi:hypothetical protein
MARLVGTGTIMVTCAVFAALALLIVGSVPAQAPAQVATTTTSTSTFKPVPSVSMTSSSGIVGAVISVSGANYNTSDTSCALSSNPSTLLQAPACTVLRGSITASFTVAADAVAGSYIVRVTSSPSGDTAWASFTVLPAIPTTTMTTTAATSATTTTVTSTTPQSTATTTLKPPKCVIATATFGSEASPAVQFLRNFRDQLVLSTKAGSAFMDVFNAWYYSFSPSVASVIANNEALRAVTRVLLYPLLGALGISALTYSVFSSSPEFAIVVTGTVASSLIGLVYLIVPALVGIKTVAKRRRVRITSLAKSSVTSLVFTLALLTVGEFAGSFVLLAVASSALVLLCLTAVPVIVASAIIGPNRR